MNCSILVNKVVISFRITFNLTEFRKKFGLLLNLNYLKCFYQLNLTQFKIIINLPRLTCY